MIGVWRLFYEAPSTNILREAPKKSTNRATDTAASGPNDDLIRPHYNGLVND